MTRRTVAVFLLGSFALFAAPVRVAYSSIARLERSFDQSILSFNINDPIDLIGSTRGVYLENYGAVFTAEVNLRAVNITPFRPKLTTTELDELRKRKIARLPDMRRLMRNMMVSTAASLATIPADEQIVVGVTLFRAQWEQSEGLPAQIVMQAKRKVLADYEAGRVKEDALAASITETLY